MIRKTDDFPQYLRKSSGFLVRRTILYASADSLDSLDLAKTCPFPIANS